MGLFGGIFDEIFGDVPKLSRSGAFSDVEGIGNAFSEFLLNRLTSDPGESDEFLTGSQIIRDAATSASKRARQRLGDASVTGGFLDSGAVARGLSDIDRAELEAILGAERELLMGVIDRQTEGILPFLTAASNENIGVGTANIQGALGARGQNFGFTSDFLNSFTPF